jgi:hypothetical protein
MHNYHAHVMRNLPVLKSIIKSETKKILSRIISYHRNLL